MEKIIIERKRKTHEMKTENKWDRKAQENGMNQYRDRISFSNVVCSFLQREVDRWLHIKPIANVRK